MNFAMDESIDVQKSPANVGHGPVGDDELSVPILDSLAVGGNWIVIV